MFNTMINVTSYIIKLQQLYIMCVWKTLAIISFNFVTDVLYHVH